MQKEAPRNKDQFIFTKKHVKAKVGEEKECPNPRTKNEEFKSDQTTSEATENRERGRERERERERKREREKRATGERERNESKGRKEEIKGSPSQLPTTSLIRKRVAWPYEVCRSYYTVRSLACWCSPQNNGTRSI